MRSRVVVTVVLAFVWSAGAARAEEWPERPPPLRAPRAIDVVAATPIVAVEVVDTLSACFQSRDDSHAFVRAADGTFPGHPPGEIERIRDVVLRSEDLPLDAEALGITEASVDAHREDIKRALLNMGGNTWTAAQLDEALTLTFVQGAARHWVANGFSAGSTTITFRVTFAGSEPVVAEGVLHDFDYILEWTITAGARQWTTRSLDVTRALRALVKAGAFENLKHPLHVERWVPAFYSKNHKWRSFMNQHHPTAPLPFRAPNDRVER